MAAASGYIFATTLQAAGNFAFLALATRLLGAEQYGHWALLEPVLLLGGQITTLGLSYGVIKLIAQDGRAPEYVLRAVGRIGLLVSTAVALLLAIATGLFLKYSIYTILIFVIFVCEGRFVVMQSILRGSGNAKAYAHLVALRVFTSVGLLFLLLHYLGPGKFQANQLAAVWLASISIAISGQWLLSRSVIARPLEFDRSKSTPDYKLALAYGAPILGATILSAILANADRYVLTGSVPVDNIAQYVLAGKIAAILNLCVTPLNLWWPTARFRHLNDKDEGRFFFRSASFIICSLLATLSASVFLFAPELLSLLAPLAEFDPVVTGLLCLSALCLALTGPMNIGGLKQGHTHWAIVSVAVAAAAQIGLSLFLIPYFGLRGAASATLISAFLCLVFQNFVSQRIHRVPFKYLSMFLTVGFWLLVVVVAYQLPRGLVPRIAVLCVGIGLQFTFIRISASWALLFEPTR